MIDVPSLIRTFLISSVSAAASGTLQSDISATGTAIGLAGGEGASFPSYQTILLKIDSEYILATRSTDTLTVVEGGRGKVGSTAAVHTAGATVSQANFYMVIGANIFYEQVPIKQTGFDNTYPAVLYHIRGGDSDPTAAFGERSLVLKCFGGSKKLDDPHIVYRLLHDRLHQCGSVMTSEGNLMLGLEDGAPQDLLDPDTYPNWHYTMATYRVMVQPR